MSSAALRAIVQQDGVDQSRITAAAPVRLDQAYREVHRGMVGNVQEKDLRGPHQESALQER